ncbi:MAG: hypothetical protein HC886_18085 [Leptolyngbyaceae cyanobacterium SM1_1_3]|nr:hypothetical protein [Leptolyngbyaceae cyanobacterium SM1_1_3]NJN01511.1 hypothetical protein [Leptolyngbyaceae cyanobacterium RM1_1_2]NJO08681.1 hypothetical protein [Leptolyngbyaceae cyanobacterium SL_1_1]
MNTAQPGPGFGFTFLYYFAGIGLITTLLVAQSLHVGLETGFPAQLGTGVGLLGGLLAAYFNQTLALELPFKGKQQFLRSLNQALSEMGYTLVDEEAGALVYQRSPLRQLFSGRVYVLLSDKSATVFSRAIHIRNLQRRLA